MTEPSPMKSINASFAAMSKILTNLGKAMRLERELEAQENERRLRTRDLKNAAEALDKKHASPRSRRIVLTGLNEYHRVVHPHSQPEPASTISPSAPGFVLSAVVAQPIAWLWQHYLPLGALTLLEGEPGSGTSLLALHIAACVTSGRTLPGGSPSTQGTVILVADQDHPGYTIAPRFLAAGGDPARVLLLSTVEQVDSDNVKIEDRPFSLARDLCFLEEAVTRTNAALVILDSLGAYAHPLPADEDSDRLPFRNVSLLRQTILSTLEECAAPMNARSLATITGFSYENVRKLLQRMVHYREPELVSPARGLYTTPGHPCLAKPAASSGTPPAEPPVPTVAPVPPVPGPPPSPNAENDPASDSPKPPASTLEVDSRPISTNPLSQPSQASHMEYRTLGRTGWKISAIGFGAWGIGGSDWGSTDDTTSLAALHRAIDLGVNFIDTADVYGDGHSEQLIAQVRKARSEQLIIATKVGRRLNPHIAQGYTRQNLTAFVERSLRNLEMEALDVLQLHCPPSDVYDMPEVFSILDDLVQQGKIRFYGVSVERVDEALKAVSYPHVQSVQLIFNLFRLKPSEHFFAVAHERQVGILARVPLASGLLTGKFRPDTHFAPNDHRSFNHHGEAFDQGETFSGIEYETGLQAVEALRPFVPQGWTMAQFALRWILMFPEVTSAIPGGKNPGQVEENVNAAALPPLSPVDMIVVETINDGYIWPQVRRRW